MKYLIIVILLFVVVSVKGQPLPQLKDSARKYYFHMLEMMNSHDPNWTKAGFDTAINKYDYYREAVLSKIKPADQQAFFNWLVSEARAQGSLKHHTN